MLQRRWRNECYTGYVRFKMIVKLKQTICVKTNLKCFKIQLLQNFYSTFLGCANANTADLLNWQKQLRRKNNLRYKTVFDVKQIQKFLRDKFLYGYSLTPKNTILSFDYFILSSGNGTSNARAWVVRPMLLLLLRCRLS